MRKKVTALPCLVAAVFLPPSVLGAVDPQAVDVGAFQFIPTLQITQKRDDNIFAQPNQVESSWITQFQPTLQFVAQDRNNTYALSYLGDYGQYWDSDDDDYDDHTVSGDFHFDLSDMHTVDIGASFGKLHDPRGEGASEGIIALSRDEADEYDITGAEGVWAIGRPSARFGAELEAGYTDIEYTNNRFETQFRDRDEDKLAGRLYGALAPKTRVFIEYATTDINYDNLPLAGARLDSDEENISLGVTWEATARTQGSIKIGRLDKEFDSAARGSTEFTSWDAELIWSPRTYSHLFLTASNTPRETNGTGNFVEDSSLAVTWVHDWSERLHSTASIGTGDSDYDNNIRQDDNEYYSASVNYDLERWINIGASINYNERDSNVSIFDYDRTVFALNFTFSL